jgi:hypothetical protein
LSRASRQDQRKWAEGVVQLHLRPKISDHHEFGGHRAAIMASSAAIKQRSWRAGIGRTGAIFVICATTEFTQTY